VLTSMTFFAQNPDARNDNLRKVGIIGAGLIGFGWVIVFAKSGW
jgi:hypothetical protein